MDRFYVLTASVVPDNHERQQAVTVTGQTDLRDVRDIYEMAVGQARRRLDEYVAHYGRFSCILVTDFFGVW